MMENKKLLMGILVIGFLLVMIFSLFHSISPYTTVSKLVEMGNANNVQVVGEIVKGSILMKDNKTYFKITDGVKTVDVVYNGRLNYYEGQIVIIGDFKNRVLYATEVLRKCHTEYRLEGK